MIPDEEKQEQTAKSSIDGIEIDGDINTILALNKDKPEQQPEPLKGDPDNNKFGDIPIEFAENYKGKSSEELINELYKKQQYIGKLGNEVGNKRKSVTTNPLEELEDEELSLNAKLKKIEKQIKESFDDELDKEDDDYKKLSKKKEELLKAQRDLSNRKQKAEIEETVRQQMYTSQNKKLLEEKKDGVAKQLGLDEIPNEHWDTISKKAQEYAGTGNEVTDEDVQAAVIKTFGADFVHNAIALNVQQKVRTDIAGATQKATTVINGKEGGTSIENLTDEQQIALINHLANTKQYEKLAQISEKIKKARRM